MSGPYIAGTFSTGSAAVAGNASAPCVIPTSKTQMRLTLTGCDASNTVKTRKRTTPGGAWVDQTTYSTNQNEAVIAVAAGEEWQLVHVTAQAIRDLRYVLDAQ